MRIREFTQDMLVVSEILLANEYGLPDRFQDNDTVVDIGAHIGCFALDCFRRGAGRITCYEPDNENFALLMENTAPYKNISPRNLAIWQGAGQVSVVAPGGERWTGQRQVCDFGFEREWCPPPQAINCISLDEALEREGQVRLLKMDCEGSEYPSVFSASREALRRAQEIVMEVHDNIQFDHPVFPSSHEGIAACLRGHGFRCETRPHPRSDWNYLLRAERID